MKSFVALAALALLAVSVPAAAQTTPGDLGFTPRVPVSGLARPSLGIDPSRLRISTSVSVGAFGGGMSGLQVTSFQYQFRQPLALSLSLGNAWGGGGFDRGGAFFLEGLDLTYRPSGSFMIHVGYQDLRSPLQRGFQPYPRGPYGALGPQ